MITHSMHPVARAVRAHFHDATVLAAVSGGPDSMAMLDALCELARERPGLSVVAAHFDHRLRADSACDAEAVAAFAAARGVRVIRGEGDVRAHARATKRSLEEAARDLRYEFLERAAREAGADRIATAHTRSDQAETVLMRILRGAGARGVAGIPAVRGRIVRPLLEVSRDDTRAYCRARAVPYALDPSNDDRRHLRNRIRHDVLPDLRTVYPGIDAALERLAANARDECTRADLLVEARVARHLRAGRAGEHVLGLGACAGLDDDERQHLLARALEAVGARRDVSRAHYAVLIRLAREGARTGAAVDLPRLRVRREHDGLVFAERGAARAADGAAAAELRVPGRVIFGGWEIRAEPAANAETHAPLTVRFPRPGDRMQPFGMRGTRKLSDLFIDAKVPRRLRAHTPVVESGGEILHVAGVAASEKTRVVPGRPGGVRISATALEETA